MGSINEVEAKSIRERIITLALRDDLSMTAIRLLAELKKKTSFTDDDLWFLKIIEDRYGAAR